MEAPLSPPARLGLHLALGAAVLIVAAWLFGAIAEDVVTGDRITIVDAQLAAWLRTQARPALTTWMLAITDLHSTLAVSSYAALAALWFAYRRQWRRIVTLILCLAGGMALNVAMKFAFHRARPALDDPLLTLSSYSFPSGHVVASTILYGLLVVWVFVATSRTGPRIAALGLALLAIAIVAFTRMYLGVHYLTDVGAAFLEGIAWLALSLGGLAGLWRRTSLLRPPRGRGPAM